MALTNESGSGSEPAGSRIQFLGFVAALICAIIILSTMHHKHAYLNKKHPTSNRRRTDVLLTQITIFKTFFSVTGFGGYA